jgi:CO dehydrogenase/acetyl-CoA synthase delta subunit
MPLTLETKSDPKTGKVSSRKVTVGDVEVPDKGSGVVVVDLTGEKPAYKFVKVELPACKVDLVDKERKTWPGAIDEAIAELKKKSKELAMLAD